MEAFLVEEDYLFHLLLMSSGMKYNGVQCELVPGREAGLDEQKSMMNPREDLSLARVPPVEGDTLHRNLGAEFGRKAVDINRGDANQERGIYMLPA